LLAKFEVEVERRPPIVDSRFGYAKPGPRGSKAPPTALLGRASGLDIYPASETCLAPHPGGFKK
jgi:hypothetical protein